MSQYILPQVLIFSATASAGLTAKLKAWKSHGVWSNPTLFSTLALGLNLRILMLSQRAGCIESQAISISVVHHVNNLKSHFWCSTNTNHNCKCQRNENGKLVNYICLPTSEKTGLFFLAQKIDDVHRNWRSQQTLWDNNKQRTEKKIYVIFSASKTCYEQPITKNPNRDLPGQAAFLSLELSVHALIHCFLQRRSKIMHGLWPGGIACYRFYCTEEDFHWSDGLVQSGRRHEA